MSNSIRHDFHSVIANLISDDIQFQHSKYYYYLGKTESWGVTDNSPSLMQVDSELENLAIRSNIVYVKNISPNDISLVIDRHNWTSGVTYSVWDNTKNMEGVVFYCVTDDNNVYKCLDNNGGVPSTVKPTGKSYYTTSTGDGYLWKYMYNIPTFKHTRFSNLTYIPVQRALTDTFYNKGSVDDVVVVAGGSGYSNSMITTLVVSGATTGSGAVGTIIAGGIGNITGVNITNGGSGYTAGVKISFTTSAGVGGVGTAIVAAGVITGMTIVSAGVGYTTGESIVFTVGGAVVIPKISAVTGSVVGITIIDGGAGYTGTPTVTISTSGGTGTGKYGNPTALFSAVTYGGSLVEVNTIDPGIDYSTDTSTTITVQGDGTDAEFTPLIYDGEVVGVIVENSGSGYTTMKLSVTGVGTGAILNPLLSTSDFISDQSIVEQTSVAGAIYSVAITEAGNNYSNLTTVTITGDGSGCVAHPVIVDGSVVNVVVTESGSGYTYSTVTFTDPSRAVYGVNIDATAYAILPPTGGHGVDAVSELFGSTVAINSSIRQDTNLVNLFQDYRQFGIIKNPTNILSGRKYTGQSSLVAYTVLFEDVIDLIKDEILIIDDVKFRVISIFGNTVTLQQLGIKYIDPLGVLVAETENTRTYNAVNILKYPEVNKYSGKLIYVSNENPFSFTEDQDITVKTFLKF